MSPEARTRGMVRRSCTAKRRYRDIHEAKHVRAARERSAGHALRIYACELCRGFHLTKKDEQ